MLLTIVDVVLSEDQIVNQKSWKRNEGKLTCRPTKSH